MIHIGTSGFSYDDWVGPYYPQDLKKTEWLSFYAREFSTLELNSSYYGIPTAFNMERMAAKTPEGFQFTVKAHQDMTHKRNDNEAVFAQFVAALAPLLEQGKFGCVLAQFPSRSTTRPMPLTTLSCCASDWACWMSLSRCATAIGCRKRPLTSCDGSAWASAASTSRTSRR